MKLGLLLLVTVVTLVTQTSEGSTSSGCELKEKLRKAFDQAQQAVTLDQLQKIACELETKFNSRESEETNESEDSSEEKQSDEASEEENHEIGTVNPTAPPETATAFDSTIVNMRMRRHAIPEDRPKKKGGMKGNGHSRERENSGPKGADSDEDRSHEMGHHTTASPAAPSETPAVSHNATANMRRRRSPRKNGGNNTHKKDKKSDESKEESSENRSHEMGHHTTASSAAPSETPAVSHNGTAYMRRRRSPKKNGGNNPHKKDKKSDESKKESSEEGSHEMGQHGAVNSTAAPRADAVSNSTAGGVRPKRSASSSQSSDESDSDDESDESKDHESDESEESDESDESDETREKRDGKRKGGQHSKHSSCHKSCSDFVGDNYLDDIDCFVECGLWKSYLDMNSDTCSTTWSTFFDGC